MIMPAVHQDGGAGGARPGPADRLTIHFPSPLKAGEVEVSSLTLREPTVREVHQAMDKGTVYEQMRALVSLVSGVPQAALGAMPASGYRAAEKFLMQFLSGQDLAEASSEPPPERLVLEFAAPISVGAVKRDHLLITEPTLAMLTLAAKAGSSTLAQDVQLLALASMPSGGSVELVEQMRFSDFAKGRDFLAGFTAASAQTS